jgi:hypothetical protein
MEVFFFCLLVLLAVVNLVLAISTSMVLVKIFEIVKTTQDNQAFADEAKLQARGLLDVETPQVPYSLRMR